MRVTQQMVAEAAGVSIATVSRGLAGHPAIPAETRRRIEQVARRLGYALPSKQKSRAHKISSAGILVAGNAAGILPEVLAGISAAAGTTGMGSAVHVVADGSPAAQCEQIGQWPLLAAGGLCGVIAVGWWQSNVLEDMLGALPYVVIGNADGPECLRNDALAEVELLHERLRQLGHRQIGFCHEDLGSRSEHLQSASFAHAETTLGTQNPAIVPIGDHKRIRKLTMSGLTAWICTGDKVADRLAAVLEEAKLGVPRDASVACLTKAGRPASPRWTSVHYDWQSLGALALARLQVRLAAGELPTVTSLIPGAVGRETSIAPPPGTKR